MEMLEEAKLCFPQQNNSCRKPLQPESDIILISLVLSSISLLTVTLNLLVIISISHFRQLHTSTNLLLLSLAVADLLVGLLLMPLQIVLLSGCWFLGTVICGVFYYASFILTSASVGTIVLISVDRYVAICDPLCYPTKVTNRRVKISVCLCWCCSVLYNGVILHSFLENPEVYNTCHGECVVVIDFISGAIDVAVTFICPISTIVVLYVRIFIVAVSQARAMRSHINSISVHSSVQATAKKSERKAARILGILVVVFVVCFCPYFYPSLSGEALSTDLTFSIFGVWLLYCNSCINPVIYTFFYPWFRKSIKLIVTLQILQPDSCDAHIL